MNALISTLTAILTAIPVGAKSFPIVNPTEQMVIVPGLEFVGASRLSTVKHCATLTGTTDWQNLITDSDFEMTRDCLIEHK